MYFLINTKNHNIIQSAHATTKQAWLEAHDEVVGTSEIEEDASVYDEFGNRYDYSDDPIAYIRAAIEAEEPNTGYPTYVLNLTGVLNDILESENKDKLIKNLIATVNEFYRK